MQPDSFGRRIVTLLLFALLLLPGARLMAAPAQVATVQTASGALSVRRSGGSQFVAISANSGLYVGDVLRTGAGGRASVLFSSGAQVRLNANTSIEITPPAPVGHGKQSVFRALVGEVYSRLRPGDAVQTRSAIAGVRGTTIDLVVNADSTTLTVVEGEVDFFNEFGSVPVGQSQQSVARPGSAPTAPVTVNNAGFIVEWTLDLDRAVLPREKFFFNRDAKLVREALTPRAARASAEPQSAVAQREYGDALFDSRDYAQALVQYQKADGLAPKQPATLSRMGDALQELNRLDEARIAYNSALEAGGQAVPRTVALETATAPASSPILGLAWLDLRHNRPGNAQALAARALKESPAKMAALGAGESAPTAEAGVALGLALMRQPDKLNQAAETFQTALQAEPAAYRYQAHAWLALVHLQQNDGAAALREGQAATAEAPDSALAHGNLALVYFYLGQPREARREGQAAVQLDPSSVAAKVALGQALLAQGDVDAAASTAAQASALDPSLPQARYLLGIAEAGRRDYVHAARELEAANQLAPNFLPATAALARVYNGMGRQKQAVALLTSLVPRERDQAAVRAALGEVYYQQGKYREGAGELQTAVKDKPQSALYQSQLSRLLLDANQLNGSIVAARKAVELAPRVGQYHAQLGLAYGYSGLRTQAEREFREALILDPQNALALAQLAVQTADVTSGNLNSTAGLRAAEAARSTQAFLLDPAVSRQLVRGGVNLELAPRAGNEDQSGMDLLNRAQSNDGRLNALTLFGRDTGDGSRDNDGARTTNLESYATYLQDPRTNLYFNVRGLRTSQGLAGPDLNQDTDDHSLFRFGQAQIAARRRLGANQYLWAGLFANTARNTVTNPGLNSFFDADTGLPVTDQRVDSHALQPELRFDLPAGESGGFTLGAARTHAKFESSRRLLVPVGSRSATDEGTERDRQNLLYAQWRQDAGPKLSFITQLRYQDIDRNVSRTFTNPGFPTQSGSGGRDDSHWLPSFMLNYHADKKTTFRLFANRRSQDVTTSTFAPTETLLTTEDTSMPFGTAVDPLQHFQLDAERYLGERDYLKFFVFHTSARNVQIGGSNVLGFVGLPDPDAPALSLDRWRGTGGGMRYERQLARSLFANAGLFLRSTSSENSSATGAAFDGGRAPYEPSRLGLLELNYIDRHGNKMGFRLRHVGAFYEDVPSEVTRPTFPARTYCDLLLAREPALSGELYVQVLNLFNTSAIDFNGYRTNRRRLEFGVVRRF